jgi:hypothetical protein
MARHARSAAEQEAIASVEAERIEAARKALDADIAAALDLVTATTPLPTRHASGLPS